MSCSSDALSSFASSKIVSEGWAVAKAGKEKTKASVAASATRDDTALVWVRITCCGLYPGGCRARRRDPAPPGYRRKAVLAAARSHKEWPTLLKITVPEDPRGRSRPRKTSSSSVASDQRKAPAFSAWIRSPASSSAPSIVSTTTAELETRPGGNSAASGWKEPTAATNVPSATASGSTGSG